MKSRITIEIDHDNQPVLKVDYVHSEDVRDTLVKRFLETFGADSCWAKFHYDNKPSEYGGTSRTAIVRPISPYDLPEEALSMTSEAKLQLVTRKSVWGKDHDRKFAVSDLSVEGTVNGKIYKENLEDSQ